MVKAQSLCWVFFLVQFTGMRIAYAYRVSEDFVDLRLQSPFKPSHSKWLGFLFLAYLSLQV
jgi:hypothetical protein